MTKSSSGLKWQECGRWICRGCRCFDLSRLSQDSKAAFASSFSLSLCFLSERAGWLDNQAQLQPQLCTGPQQTMLFISLIGHIWLCYFHLWVVQRRGAGGGTSYYGAEVGLELPGGCGTGCKALAKSNMAVFAFVFALCALEAFLHTGSGD